MIAIRTRILAPTIILVIFGSLALGLLAWRDSHREIEEVYDAQLVQAARLLEGILQRQDDPQQTDWAQIGAALDAALDRSGEGILSHPYEINLSFQIWSQDGQLLVRSQHAPLLPSPPAAGLHDLLIDGQNWCGVLLQDRVHGMRIWVGEQDDLRQDLIQRIVQHALIPTLIGLPLLAMIIWLLLGWGLRPLQRLAWQIRARPADSLDPLNSGPLPPELEPMRTALDRLLGQLRCVLERERRFIADAAHELRTPLAVIDIHVQNARQASNKEERNEALDFLQQGVRRATRTASQLLTMARLEPAGYERRPLDLVALVREELAELAPLALSREVELVLDNESDCSLLGEPSSIAILLQNLLSNALAFAPKGSEVRVRLRHCSDQEVELQVLDEGPGVSDAMLNRLCDRFYSEGNPDGVGLGLAIVEMISLRMGGVLQFSNRDQGGFCVQLRFPRQAHS
ncbi:ATP-binding protein [Pseudomonas sp. 5P_3.1_Bac2]|uniref:ATP-binding protein n=1 Tax=Pseudomonas sp. 5P_3.1_Bac2 TaxID=2971617 RepID=UPI0021C83C0E|nr:ATP-binding protein [Pseudomonas sp. 5P_3.1_Bac2]MCU1717933.1 ATP-binding protein [Pseudomonas sp. 5P_3.1_Bac2]